MNVNDDPRCLCPTDWADDVGIRNVTVQCPVHGLHKEEHGSESLVAAFQVPEIDADSDESLVIIVRRHGRDGTVRETRYDANTVEMARTQGRIDELTTRLDRAE